MAEKPQRLKKPVYPMPDCIRRELVRSGLMEAYRARPPYQRNDYVGWITQAKREETRRKHLDQMLDELERGDTYMKIPYGPGKKLEGRDARSGNPLSVDEYLERLPDDARAALGKLRRAIRTAAPGSEETIAYRMPVFKYLGPLVGFAAFKDHLSFFVMSTEVMGTHRKEIEGFDTAKGTIRFQADRPPSAALVKSLVKARVAENMERANR